MKNWIKKIGQNKFQFFFFIGIISVLALALIISASVDNNVDEPLDDNPPTIVTPDDNNNDKPADTKPEEVLVLPFAGDIEYVVVRKFYDKNASQDDQVKALIKYGNTYRTSNGVGYSKKDNTSFDVLTSLSGKVVEIKDSPLYGNYVIVEHNNSLKTKYYGLSEVSVNVGDEITQGTKVGVSGNTDIDKDAGNHVYFQVIKENKYVNPEMLIGKKISEI